MKRSEFINLMKEELNTLYPKGGSIGGPHKQSIKDKDFKGKGTLPHGNKMNAGDSQNLFREKHMKLADRYLGIPWDPYGNKNTPMDWFFERLISTITWAKKNKEGGTYNKFVISDMKDILGLFPQAFAHHFGIDVNSDKSIAFFLEFGADSFLKHYEEFKAEVAKINRGEESV